MTDKPGMSTATAILLGSGLIAVALFLGLSRAQPGPPAPVSATPVVEATPVVAAPAVRPVASREQVARQAQEALAYQKADLLAKCRPPAGEQHRYVLHVTFDPEGMEAVRGISEDRSNPTPGLVQCVSLALTKLRVPAPGAVVPVEVPLSLP